MFIYLDYVISLFIYLIYLFTGGLTGYGLRLTGCFLIYSFNSFMYSILFIYLIYLRVALRVTAYGLLLTGYLSMYYLFI